MQGHSGILPTTGGYKHTIRKDVYLFIREESLSKESLSRLATVGSHAHTWLQRNLGNELWHVRPLSWLLRVWPGRKKLQGGDGCLEAAMVSDTHAQSKDSPSLLV